MSLEYGLALEKLYGACGDNAASHVTALPLDRIVAPLVGWARGLSARSAMSLIKIVALSCVLAAIAACAGGQPAPAAPTTSSSAATPASSAQAPATAACEAAGGTCTNMMTTVACKSQPAIACGANEICCVM